MTTVIAGPLPEVAARRATDWVTDARWDGSVYLAAYAEYLADEILAPIGAPREDLAWLVVALSRRTAELRFWDEVTA